MARCCKIVIWVIFLNLWVLLCTILVAHPQDNSILPVEEKKDIIAQPDKQAIQKKDSALLFLNNKHYLLAQKLAEQSISAASAAKDWSTVLSNYKILIAIDSITNNYHAAFEHLKEKEKIAQEIYTIQKEEIAYDIREQYQPEKLQQKISGMEENLRKTERKAKIRNSFIVVAMVLTCLFLIIGIIQMYLYRREKRVSNSIISENEQNEHQLKLLTEQIDESFETNQRLSQENTALEKSNMVKDKLLSVISHDLRSPMSSLQALLNLFKTKTIARKDLIDFFGKLLSRVENTSTMLENLLHWSQYQLQGIEPIFEKVDMQKVIDDSINFYRMQADQKHIVIDNSLKTSVHVRADIEMLKIILRNLISNALKFTHTGGIITIKAMTKDRSVIVSVKDTGVGISPENQAKMFAMADYTTPGTEQEKGTGLGLMLCKDFVEHNHGKIWLDSKVNVGTTFYFNVPLAEE